MNKSLFFTVLFILKVILINSENIIIANKVAKIGNEIILKNDVDKYSKYFKLNPKEAKNILIENAILYTGAKMFAKEPTQEEVNDYYKKQKNLYASKVGKEAKNVPDDEFLKNLNFSGLTIITYKNEIKREIWINKYIEETITNKKITKYVPTAEEINSYIKSKPENFSEQEGIYFSMIYFSFYNEKGEYKKKEERDLIESSAKTCLKELKNGEKFENMVEKYSYDLISKNNNPKGKVGFLAFDDPKSVLNFSEEILNDFKKNNKGVINKVFTTKNGSYIFRIDEKVKAKKLSKEAAALKAETILVKDYENKLKENLTKEIIKDLITKIEIIYY